MRRALGFVGGAIAMMIVAAALSPTSTSAQNFDCIGTKDVWLDRANPFTGEVEQKLTTVKTYDEDCERIRDGRENINDYDAGAAIYCNDYGIDIYDLDISGNGTLSFTADWAEILAVPPNPEANTLIDGAPGFALYRLTSGEMQLNGVKEFPPGAPYIYIWAGCEPPQTAFVE